MRASRFPWVLLSLIAAVTFSVPGMAAPAGGDRTAMGPGARTGGGGFGKETGIPVAPDSWRGFDQLSPAVQANLRRQPLSPEGSPIQPPNVRANDITGDAANEVQGEATVAAWNQYVVVVWFDSRGFDGDPQFPPNAFIGFAYSCDFGATFTDGGSPPRLAANDLPYQGTVVVDDAGTFYLAANYGVNLDVNGNWGQDVNVVYAGHFTGCAFAWDPPVIAATATDFFDMPYIATSPVIGTVHIVESRYAGGLATVEVVTSTDGGATWGAPVTVSAPGRIDDPSIATGPGGEVYVTYLDDWWGYYQCDLSSPNWYIGVQFSRSLDGGATFSSPALIATKTSNLRLNTGPGVWRGWDTTPTDVAVDKSGGPRDGAIYVAWQEAGAWSTPVETGAFVTESEPNDVPAAALTVSLGDSAVGTSSPGESDYWRFSLTQGQSAIMRLEPDDFSCANNSTAQRYVLRLYSDPADPNISPPDTLLAYSNTGVWIQQIVFTAHKTGDYYLRVLHVSGGTSGYTLRTAAITMGPDAATPARDEGDIVAVVSTDGGTTFGSKVLVSGDAPAGLREDFPCVAVDGSGTAWFSWYDRRESLTTPGAVNTAQLTDIYLRGSDDLLATFSPGERVTDESSTNSGFPRTTLGYNDFQGLWADGGHLVAGWGDQRGSNAATSHFDAYTNFLDLEPPVAAFETAPAESAHVIVSDIPFEWTGTDRKSVSTALEYATELDGGGYGAYSPDTTSTVSTSEGWHTFAVRARDEAGNEGGPASLDFAVDLTPPSASFTAGPEENQAIVVSDVSFAWSGSDNLSPTADLDYAYRLDGGGFTSWAPDTTVDLTELGLGPHVFDVDVRDLSGRTARITRNFSVDNAVRWAVDADGDWGNPANWNTGTVPTAADSVVIDRAAGTYTVTVSGGDQAARVVTCEENLVLANGFLTVSGDLLVDAGLHLAGGRLVGARILSGPGTAATYASGCTLTGVVLGAELSPAIANAGLYVENGLTLEGGTVNLAGAASLIFLGSQTLGGTGEVVFTDGNSVNMIRNNAGGDVLTVGPGITIHGERGQIMTSNDYGYLVNQGTIRGDVTSGSGISIWRLVSNSNLMEADGGGTVQILSGTWTNTGTLRAQNGGILALGGVLTTAGLGTWEGVTGTVRLTGALDNTGNTFTVSDATGSPVLYLNGRLTGGTVQASGSAQLLYGGGTLDGVTLAGPAAQATSSSVLYVENGLDLQGAAVNIGQGSALVFKGGNQAMSGTGEFVFTDGSASNQIRGNAVDDTLTVDTGVTIHGERGDVMSNGDYGYLVNHGILRADVANGNGILVWKLVSTSNLIEADGGGTIQIRSGTWTNTGTLRAQNGGVLALGGVLTTAGLGTWEGVTGTVRLTGALDNTGDTFTVSDATGSPVLHLNGRLTGGTVQASGSAQLLYGGGTLDGVTLAGPAAQATSSSILYVENGLTLQGAAVNIGQGSALIFKGGNQAMSGTGEFVFTDGSASNQIRGNAVDDTLTVDTGVTIHGERGDVMSNGDYGYLVNQGTIRADVANGSGILVWKLASTSNLIEADGGGTVQIRSGTWTNTGTLRAQNGGTFRCASPLISSGVVQAGAGSLVDLQGGQALITGGNVIVEDTGTLASIADLTLQGGVLQGFGTVNATVDNSSEIAPGASPGTLTLTGDLNQTGAGSILAELAGSDPAAYDRLLIGQSAALAGTLDVSLIDGYTPAPEDTFTVLEYGDHAGSFDQVNLPSLPGGMEWMVDAGASALRLITSTADSIPPVTVLVTAPPDGGWIAQDSVFVSWTATDDRSSPGAMLYSYELDGGGATPFTLADTTATFTGLAPGPHTFQVAARDEAGNTDPTPAQLTFNVDLAAPSVLFASGPAEGATADTADVAFTWHGSDDLAPEDSLEFATQLDGGGYSAFAPDTSGAFTGLAEGPHSVDVVARDLAGNTSAPASRGFFVDLAAPAVNFTAGPAENAFLDTAGVALAWTAVDAVAPRDSLEFATQLDGGGLGPFGPDSTADLAGLAEGPHAFEVQARDPVGHVGSAVRNFTVDLTPPVAFATAGPPDGGYADSLVALGWSGTDNLSAPEELLYSHELDGAGYSAAAPDTTVTLHNLPAGAHTFYVRAIDVAGNVGLPYIFNFDVDVLDPETSITAGPAEGDTVSTDSAAFPFTGTDDKSPVDSLRYAYRVDGGAYSPFSLTASAALSGLADGSHTFEVKSRDLAGHEDPTPAARTFLTDAQPPAVALTAGPAEDDQVNVTAVDFAWTATDAVTARNDLEFATRLDGGTLGSWSADSTAGLASLSEGLHSFEVRARDLAGHEGALVRHYRVDLTPPFVDPPTAQVKDESKVRFTLTANDVGGVRSFHVQVAQDITFATPELETTLVATSPGTLDFQGSFGNTYYARTLATDIAGNQSGYSDHSNGAVIALQPDLLVTQVQAPTTAYSGQSILVSWTVADSGLGGTNVPQWSDRVYLSPTPALDLGTAVTLGTAQNLTYLNVNESYTNQQIFTLPNGISGTFYAIVETDVLDDLSESDAGNNLGISSPVDVSLSASADLQVTALSVPTNAFSGDPITVSWTVQNLGTGRTDVDNWYDTVFLSPDPSLDYTLSSGSIKFLDRPLGSLLHVGAMDPDSTYNTVLEVTIPPEVSGTQYLFVWSDLNVSQSGVYVGERGDVFENVGEFNNAGGLSDNIAVTLTPPADLVVDAFTAPAAAASGQTLSLSWTVRNGGLNPTFESFWNDRVYMSTDDQFGGDALVATVGHNGVLDRDSTYTAGAQIQLSPSLSGSRWFFVVTDGTGLALELDETNNTSAGAMTDVTLSPWPDLVVTSVVAQDAADAGSSIPVSWRVANQGAGALPSGTWFDRIYLSASPTFDPNLATLLKEITVSAAGGNVHGTTVGLSSSLNGTYYLFAVADSRQNVFENTDEGNNVSPGRALQVVPHGAVDLAIDNLSVPGTLYSGGTFPVSWTVTNLGAGRTLVSSWGEQVYLSTDEVLSPSTDLLVLGTSHSGALDSGAAYTQNKQFTIPNGFSGDYYVLVITAPGGSGTGDVDLTNNTVSSGAPPIPVGLTPAPDLAVSAVQATGTPLAGQSIRVHWTVDNLGSGPPVPTDWTMSVYLSQDPLLGGDLHLGSRLGGGSLAPAASYQDSMDVELPSYISGPYYLVVKTDAQDRVYEAGVEGNNVLSTPVNITFPTPADLEVTGVTGPATATPGDPVTVSWTVANVGENAATGVFREAVYVSLDSVFVSTEDPLVGIGERSINLAPGASIEMEKQITLSQAYLADLAGNITETLPGIPPGDYYFLVRTNIRANIRELDFSNNLGHADLLTTVDVPILTIDVPETFALGDGQSSYYRIPAPSDLDMSVTVSSDESDATNELFVAFNRPPALNDFDFTGPAEFTANPSLLVPSTQAGDYYVLVRTRALPLGASTQNITLKAHAVPFSLASISPDAGGRQGEVSCTLRGAGFRDTTQVYLRFNTTFRIDPVQTTFVNTTELRLRWDLTGVPETAYDVVAMNGGQAVTLPSGFRVEAPLDLRLEATAVHPDVIRDNSTAYFTFKYRNAANWNVPYARIRIVYPASANLVSLSTGSKLYSRSELLPASTVPVSGDVYAAADSATGSALQVLDLLAADTAPGEEIVCTLGLKEFPGSPFSVRTFSEILDTGSFLASEAERIDAVRNAVLLDPGSYAPATVVLAADAAAFRDSALTRTYVDRGLLSANQLTVYSMTGFGSRVEATAPMSADHGWLDRIRFSAMDATPPESCLVSSPVPGCNAGIEPVGTVLPDCAVCFDAAVPAGYLLPEEVVVPVLSGLCQNMNPDIDADARVVSPCDPNQITGPAGYGDDSWISAVQPSFFTVDFENLSETATAPAQVVTVQVPLDPGFDLASFKLGSMGFGNNVVAVPAGASSYTDEQYYSDIGFVVRIVAGVDIQTRTAFWIFTTLDPYTGEVPTNPYVGFLPVNDPYGHGQGFVTYTVSPASGAATGSVVSAQAEITFDTNPALSTNLATNTLDAGLPSSAVVSSSPVDSTTYDLQWTGDDPASGSGLRDFTLYVRQDGGPFLLLQGNLGGSLYRFSGETGHVYGFFTLARDNSGNMEPVKTQPEEEVGIGQTGVPDGRTPLRLGLLQNSPNPFRSATMIRFTLPEKSRVTLNMFNVAGRLVRSVYDGDPLPAGVHDVEIRSDGLASGVYFYRLQVGDKRFTRKMLLIH